MIRFIYIFLAIAIFACTPKAPEIGYKITGTIDSLKDGQVILKRYFDGNWNNIDTSTVQSEKFEFTGKVDLPEMYRIEISDTLPYIPVFVDNNNINITGKLDSLKLAMVSGSKIQEEYETFLNEFLTYKNELDSVEDLYVTAKHKGNVARMNELDTLYESIADKQAQAMMPDVLKNNSSIVSAYVTWTKLVYNLNLDELEAISTNFDSTISKSVYAIMLKDYLLVRRRVDIGQPAVDFTMNDPDGKPVSLSSLYGKYLLIDFWASWCSPCRRENPNVVKAYKQFHKKGFDVIGVSFDKTREAWLKAIKDDKLDWTHVSDLKFWGNEAGKAYGIRSIPSNVLLNPDGVIIAKNLFGKDLEMKLQELLK